MQTFFWVFNPFLYCKEASQLKDVLLEPNAMFCDDLFLQI